MNEKNLKNAKILVVDDQESNVDFLCDYLETEGYQNIRFTTDPRDVLQLVTDSQPDLILLDLSMPYLSGFDVMELLKTIIPSSTHLPILVLTADVTIETKRKALLSGACDYLTKPFDLIELQARVNTHLEIKFKNEQIKEYSYELEKLIATKDKFFSIIAHDLRNPFVGIENYVKILLQLGNYEPKSVESNLRIICSTAQQGHELLENLLKWSKSQTGNIDVNFDMHRLNDIVNNCLSYIQSHANNKNIKIIKSINDDVILETDQDMLETVLRNLLSNAIKFTPLLGTVTLEATTTNNIVEITITDTGVGISESDKKKLFKIDSKLQSRKGTAQETGSGLGLILCKEFIDLLHGNIMVESKIDEGTTFIVTLPAIIK
jgi:signal transduction histidine kinase